MTSRLLAMALLLTLGSCTYGLEQDFDLKGGFPITVQGNDTLFELEALGGNDDEAFEHFRVEPG